MTDDRVAENVGAAAFPVGCFAARFDAAARAVEALPALATKVARCAIWEGIGIGASP